MTKAETDKHFAQQFCGSVARSQLALLDPHDQVRHVADAFATLLAGGKMALLDLPSGAGALSLGLLCTIAELRSRGVLPRHPLDITIIGGEISAAARSYADKLFRRVVPDLARQAIFVNQTQVHWDACDKVDTTRLLQRFLGTCAETDRKVVAISNFSAFLSQHGKQKQVFPQLEDVFQFSSGANSSAIWIEPQLNGATATGGVFTWVVKQLREKLTRFVNLVRGSDSHDKDASETEADFVPPMTPNIAVRVRLAVLRFELHG